MDKVKKFFSSMGGKIVLIFSVIFSILIYILDKKNREIVSFKAKAKLVKTEQEAKDLKREINAASKERDMLKGERESINEALNILKTKRKQLKEESKNKSSKDIESFWE